MDPSSAYDDFMLDMNRRGVYVIVPLTPSRGWCTLSPLTLHPLPPTCLPHTSSHPLPSSPLTDRDGSPPLSATTCYPSCLLTFGQHVVNLFLPHPNLLFFTVGNEILNSLPRWRAAPCVKAYARDIRRFMQQCHHTDHTRQVPLLYAAADNAITHWPAEENDRAKMDFLLCDDSAGAGVDTGGPDQGREGGGRAIDVMGLNLFRHCSDECTYRSCEAAKVTATFSSSPIPLLLSEYGCSTYTWHVNHSSRVGVNPFDETRLLFSPAMAAVFSGGSAYTYGVRGGEDFAFFTGGSRSARGRPGAEKSCGWPDGMCRVDQYEQRLAEVATQEAERRKEVREEREGEVDEGLIEAQDAGNPACPVILGVDLSVAASRFGADGSSAA